MKTNGREEQMASAISDAVLGDHDQDAGGAAPRAAGAGGRARGGADRGRLDRQLAVLISASPPGSAPSGASCG